MRSATESAVVRREGMMGKSVARKSSAVKTGQDRLQLTYVYDIEDMNPISLPK